MEYGSATSPIRFDTDLTTELQIASDIADLDVFERSHS
jgi:hypothetical protein